MEDLGLGMISMTSITVEMGCFMVLVSGVFGFFFGDYIPKVIFLFFWLSISTLVLILNLFKLGVAWIQKYPFFPGFCMTDDISHIS